jgi:hypothetical protein
MRNREDKRGKDDKKEKEDEKGGESFNDNNNIIIIYLFVLAHQIIPYEVLSLSPSPSPSPSLALNPLNNHLQYNQYSIASTVHPYSIDSRGGN